MRHRVDRRKLGLPSDQRRALLNNLARQLIRHGYVQTTEGRAKELRRIVDKWNERRPGAASPECKP